MGAARGPLNSRPGGGGGFFIIGFDIRRGGEARGEVPLSVLDEWNGQHDLIGKGDGK